MVLRRQAVIANGLFLSLNYGKSFKNGRSQEYGGNLAKTHDLTKLAEYGGIYGGLSDSQKDFLEDLMPLQIDGRYAEYKESIAQTLTLEKCERIYKETEEFLCWIKKKLGK